MKKIIFSGVFTLLVLVAQAQFEINAFGIGQNTIIRNTESDENIIQNKFTLSSSAGLRAMYFTSGGFGIGGSLMYSAQNQKFDAVNPIDDSIIYSGKRRLDYIKIACLAAYRFTISDQFSWQIFGGPQLAYLLKGDGAIPVYMYNASSPYFYFDVPVADSKYYNTIGFEMVVGAGIDYMLNRNFGINAGFRMDYGLTDVENKATFDERVYNSGNMENAVGKTGNTSLGLYYGVTYRFGSSHLSAPSQKFGNKRKPSYKR
ncbi:MAG: PorT family protein [Cytophagaceae bacterium]|jgi:hypothetical protein|nr:PorT family protein [Cytophagaceae bacterium]